MEEKTFQCKEFRSNEIEFKIEPEFERVRIDHIGWNGSSVRWMSYEDAADLAKFINENIR